MRCIPAGMIPSSSAGDLTASRATLFSGGVARICDAFNAARLAEREAEGEHDGEGGSSSDTTENPSHPGDG